MSINKLLSDYSLSVHLHTITAFVLQQLSCVGVTEITWLIKQNIYYLAFFRKCLPYFFLEQVYAALAEKAMAPYSTTLA